MSHDPEQFCGPKLTNFPKVSFRVSFTFLVVARYIEILEAIDNKKKGESSLVDNNVNV